MKCSPSRRILACLGGAVALVAAAQACSLSRDGQFLSEGGGATSSGAGTTTTSSGNGGIGGSSSSSGTAGTGATGGSGGATGGGMTGGGGMGGAGGGGMGGAGGGGMGGAAGGGMGGAGGGGGCTPILEDCLNGTDDDCDSSIDCDDKNSCGPYKCVPPAAGSLHVEVVADTGMCDGGLIEMELKTCASCECQVDDNGTCTHQIEVWDNSSCTGMPLLDFPITSDGCDNVNESAANGQTLGAMATPVALNDAVCSPKNATEASASLYLCYLPSAGSCDNGDACVPKGPTFDCALFDNDVACPSPYDNKQTLYDSSATLCDCSCMGGEQQCPTGTHAHLWERKNNCSGDKYDVPNDGMCHDTGIGEVQSIDNHDEPLNAADASCIDTSTPQMSQGVKTLCCL